MVPAASLTDVVRPGLVGVGDRPAEAGQLAGDGDGDDRAALAALGVQALPAAVEALLGGPGDRQHVGGLSGLAALERLPLGRCAAVVPGGLDEQPAPVPGARLGDLALPAGLAGAVLRRDQ